MTLDSVDSGIVYGEFRSSPAGNPAGSATYRHIDGVAGEYIGAAPTGGSAQQGFTSVGAVAYVIFAPLSNFVVTGASLQLDLINSVFPNGDLSIYDVNSTSANDLSALPIGSLNRAKGDALFNDFTSGVNFINPTWNKQRDINGLFNVALNTAAVSSLNSTAGLLPFSLRYLPNDPFNPIGVGFRSAPRLILTGEFTTVPSPGTLLLVMLGACLLILNRQRFQPV
jgi:hypothetical protein